MATPTISEITATTIKNRSGSLADNVSNNTALLSRLRTKGNRTKVSGGESILEELMYAENGTYKRYSGFEALNIQDSDVITAAEYTWKQAAVAVVISGLQELQNAGKEKTIDLVTSKVRNAEMTFKNNFSLDIYSDGTADGSKQIGGMQHIVADLGTGTVGGINSTTFSFWQNAIFDASGETVTLSATTIQAAMNVLYLRTLRNADHVDLIVADNNYYTFYWESLQAIQRITDTKLADAGFDNIKYKGADVVVDGGIGGNAPTDRMYFLNTDYLALRSHKDRDIVPLNPDRFATNQDAVVKLIAWAGNVTCSNRSLQGVMLP